ncbi:MAG: N-acetylmuramoyl-L-alanine amidase [Armatimonadota bacterium]
MQPNFIEKPAANLSKRKQKPLLIVLHHSGGNALGDLNWLTKAVSYVSADFYITKDGVIYKLNPQLSEYYTWHAGVSAWNGRKNINDISFGIEQEHKTGEAWTTKQVQAAARLCAWLISKFGLSLADHCIQSHAAVATPKGRKTDPENYPWEAFGKLVRGYLQ